MEYIARPLVLTGVVAGFATGDQGQFFGNLGTGAIDYATPISTRINLVGETSVTAPYNAPSASATWSFGFDSFDEPGNDSTAPTTVSGFVDCEPQPQVAMTSPVYTFATETLVLTL